jgi:N-acetylglutamate synthase-like GNAT family acetyltransferase
MTIRECTRRDIPAMFAVINDAAQAYKGVIPADRWHEPYMPLAELREEIADGVRFWGCELAGEIVGVMGIQDRGDVELIRHAYVRTVLRNQGIGSRLLKHLERLATKPVLIGTWVAADWAIRFYEKHGYRLLSRPEIRRLLKKYWRIPDRQVETSVVLASASWAKAPDHGLR